jgi:alanine-synthesizing transaminase
MAEPFIVSAGSASTRTVDADPTSLGRFRALTYNEAVMTEQVAPSVSASTISTSSVSTPRPESRRFERIERLPPYVFNITAELKMAARRRGEDIVDLSMGNPDGATPAHIVEKLCTVAQRPDTHGYSTSKGIPRLRRAIARWYGERYDVEIDPDSEAIVTIGSKEGLAHLMLATLDRGDTVLVPNPSYPIHIYGAVIAGAQIRSIPMAPGIDFFAELERGIRESIPKPKMMILGFPSNPTAQCVELDFFERVVALAKQYDVLVVHDLAYADIVYDGWKAPSIMQVPGAKDIAVEFFTLSKSYNMAGWRIGFMVGNAELVNALARIKSYHDYGTFTPLQVAAIAALEGDQQCVRDIAANYQQRRDVLVRGLHEIGWMVEIPKASMYVWAKIPEAYAGMDSLSFAKKLLAEAKVSVSPGIGFGDYGDDYVRFALIENQDRIRQALRGIKTMFRADGLLPLASSKAKTAPST